MEKKRLGRPTKAPEGNARVSLGLRVTADIKRRLDAAAVASGRSQSQEAELRIERSFDGDDALAFLRVIGALLAGMPKLTAAEADHLRLAFHTKLQSIAAQNGTLPKLERNLAELEFLWAN